MTRASAHGAAPPPPRTAIEIYDELVASLAFDPKHPAWLPALRDVHRHSRSRRLQVIPDFFYTPVFSPSDLPNAVWDATFPDCGRFDLAAQRAYLADAAAFRDELAAFPVEAGAAAETTYYWNNDQFSHADAALYYALIRRLRPRRVVEVGSGHSTKLALEAVRKNGTGSILCIEPHPPAWLRTMSGPIEVQPVPVQDASESVFLDLGPGDILFIDGSHISKTGSDVNHLFLRVLPRLPAGVLVQVHDICLPFEYARYWSEEHFLYWNEQYVLAALLANSRKFEVLVGVYYLHKTDPSVLRALIPDLPGVLPGGGSLWLKTIA